MPETVDYRSRSVEASSKLREAGYHGTLLDAVTAALAEVQAYRDAAGLLGGKPSPDDVGAFIRTVCEDGPFDRDEAFELATSGARAGKSIGLTMLQSIVAARILAAAEEPREDTEKPAPPL